MDTEIRDEKGRFVKGNPGGPGRPPTSVVSVLRRKLHEIPEGETRELLEIMVDEYLQDVRTRKDGVAFRDIIDRFDGRAKQSMELTGDPERPVGLTIVRADGSPDTDSTST